jgi:hypothetical protein
MSTALAPAGLTAAARSYLATPDAVVPLDGEVRPLRLAVSTALGLAGTGAFLGILGAGMAMVQEGSAGGSWWAAVAVPPVVAALSLPPLYLATVLQGRAPDTLRLCAVAAAGPTVAGAWLAAASPLLLLFLLTGELDVAFFLLGFATLLGAGAMGAGAAVRNASRAGSGVPNLPTVLVHYAFTAWTAAVVALHLVA